MSFLFDVGQRRRRPEIMDQPELDASSHFAALRGLERINLLSGSVRILWPALRDLAVQNGGRLKILDLASGGGDVLLGLARKAIHAGLSFALEGWDVSPRAVDYAREKARRLGLSVTFTPHDVLNDPLPDDCDAIVSSLFLHHLEEEQAVALLRRMAEASRRLVLINDLIRCRTGLLLAHVAARLLTLSPVVRFDGPVSVEGAFTIAEARQLVERAGLLDITIANRWPCRFLLLWRRP